MRIAIIGFGQEGQAALRYIQTSNFKLQTSSITVCDQDADLELPAGVVGQLGGDYLQNLDKFDLIFRSPGIRPDAITTPNPGLDPSKITTLTNEFFKACPSKNIIGITGTKGKGTTTTLIARILEATGEVVHLGGNIGVPVTDLLADMQSEDWVVLELSSFQLMDCRYSPHIGVCLMVAPDHLDWHPDMREYLRAKGQLFQYQTTDDIAVFNADNEMSTQLAHSSNGRQIGYSRYGEIAEVVVRDQAIYAFGHKICDISEVGLTGTHNLENVCAAVGAIWETVQSVAPIARAISKFQGLEHRLEFAGKSQGVTYYNDSFATTPETAVAAIDSFSEPKVVILGGSDKGSDFTSLSEVIAQNSIRGVVAIGDTAPQITAALQRAGFTGEVTTGLEAMLDIVSAARALAQAGDVVLLSPGCASFGLFNNYKDRGEQFKKMVRTL